MPPYKRVERCQSNNLLAVFQVKSLHVHVFSYMCLGRNGKFITMEKCVNSVIRKQLSLAERKNGGRGAEFDPETVTWYLDRSRGLRTSHKK